jgi:hypothetical protein
VGVVRGVRVLKVARVVWMVQGLLVVGVVWYAQVVGEVQALGERGCDRRMGVEVDRGRWLRLMGRTWSPTRWAHLRPRGGCCHSYFLDLMRDVNAACRQQPRSFAQRGAMLVNR